MLSIIEYDSIHMESKTEQNKLYFKGHILMW